MSDNTPTREQVEKAISDIASAQYDGKEPEGWQVTVVCEAADAWLEGPAVTDEMIERAAREAIRQWADYEPGADDLAIAEAMLRAALGVIWSMRSSGTSRSTR